MPAKTIFSAIINAHVRRTWLEAYQLAQTIDQLVDYMQIMTAAVPLLTYTPSVAITLPPLPPRTPPR
eukprot:1691868-Prymnesium_polylepis.1